MRRSLMNHRKAMAGGVVRVLPLMVFLGFALNSTRAVQAQTWTGCASSFWSNPSNWTPSTIPNGNSANVTINNATNNPVLLDLSPTIGNLTIGASNTLNMPGQALYISGS